jgi:prepilin-type N-terminal cleavage/methylation domain-containing protein
MNPKRFPSIEKSGFTLIEIMLALLVITIGIVAVTGLLSSSLDTSAKTHDDVNMVSFADLVFNYCHSSTNWNEIPPDGSLTIPGYDESTLALQLDELAQFTSAVPSLGSAAQQTYTVSYVLHADQPANDTKRLALKVWPGHTTNGLPRIFYTEIYNWTKN